MGERRVGPGSGAEAEERRLSEANLDSSVWLIGAG